MKPNSQIVTAQYVRAAPLACEEGIQVQMYRDEFCNKRLHQSSSADVYVLSKEKADMIGKCKELPARMVYGEPHSISRVVQCDRDGITATTFIGSSDCTNEKTQIVMRNGWNECKHVKSGLFVMFTRE